MKILTILGTRPEIIRLSRIIPRLDALCDHVLVHTGQNFDEKLSDVFFQQLGVRQPDHHWGARGSFGKQMGTIMPRMEEVVLDERPDKLLVLGDTNSSLGAIVAARLDVPVYHMEAGNRCYDDRVPEEINRRLIDHASDILLPYSERSRQNLLREGFAGERIFVTGNPIHEVIRHYAPDIERSGVMARMGLRPGNYFLVTMHRAENVDGESRLRQLTTALALLSEEHGLPVVVSTHPRTRCRLEEFNLGREESVRYLEPFGFFDFIALQRNARCVLSDSGTVQEECAILRVPNVTLRDVTERPETLEYGSSILSGADPAVIAACVRKVLSRPWIPVPPPEYVREHVSETVTNIVLGHLHARRGRGGT